MTRCKGLRGNTTRIVFGVLVFIFFVVFSGQSVNALTYTNPIGVKFTFNSAVSMSVSSNNLVISNLATGDYSDSNIIIVNVATNTVNGYTLTATVGNSSSATTDLKNTANNSYTLNSLATTDSLASMNNANVSSNGKWGYSFSTNDGSTWSNYSGLPLYTATGKTLYSTDSAENKNIWFKIGAKASSSQVAGTYANTVNFYLVTNPVSNSDINDLTYLQDFNLLSSSDKAAVKSSMTNNTIYTLIDNRDSQSYQIAKLADGNIWIIDNLNLGYSTISTDLTSTNTNLNTTVTAATFNGWKKTSGSRTYTSGEYIPVSGTDSTSGTKYGTLYNYCAASAGTICTNSNSSDATYDLCPAGWRMPTGGNNSGEAWTLSTYYPNFNMGHASISNGGMAYSFPGWFALGGPSMDFGGTWTSTRDDYGQSTLTSMYQFWVNTELDIFESGTDYRYNGFSIRCILK